MKIALAAIGFINKDINYNKNKIIQALKNHKGKADLIVFGEAYLQGFDCLCWDYQKDQLIALSQSDSIIEEIREAAKISHVAVSFGYIEKYHDKLYSSQLTINQEGNIIHNYRRISVGWREEFTDKHYVEGKEFTTFIFNNKTFLVGLCSDFWYEENCIKASSLNADIILWPVYTDFNYKEWNTSEKYEYAKQASKIGNTVLYVNSYCLDQEEHEIARGGAALFKDGKIAIETPSGSESILTVEI